MTDKTRLYVTKPIPPTNREKRLEWAVKLVLELIEIYGPLNVELADRPLPIDNESILGPLAWPEPKNVSLRDVLTTVLSIDHQKGPLTITDIHSMLGGDAEVIPGGGGGGSGKPAKVTKGDDPF